MLYVIFMEQFNMDFYFLQASSSNPAVRNIPLRNITTWAPVMLNQPKVDFSTLSVWECIYTSFADIHESSVFLFVAVSFPNSLKM